MRAVTPGCDRIFVQKVLRERVVDELIHRQEDKKPGRRIHIEAFIFLGVMVVEENRDDQSSFLNLELFRNYFLF